MLKEFKAAVDGDQGPSEIPAAISGKKKIFLSRKCSEDAV